MGRKPKYTPEEREARKIQSDKESRKKYKKKKKAETENDPELKKQETKKQVEANAKYLAKIPQEVKRKTWRIGKQAQRERERAFKQMQSKVSCETASEITIQKNTSAREAKKTVHSTVEHPV